MNEWERAKSVSSWNREGIIEWKTSEKDVCISVVFSWSLRKAYDRALFLKLYGYNVRIGGIAAKANPDFFGSDFIDDGDIDDVIYRHNPNAVFTSRGCIRSCKFCVVPKIEGELVELDRWTPRPIICDNNILACSKKHFDKVIDRSKTLKSVDFNQGLDAKLLTKYHANRIAELDMKTTRLAWDNIKEENRFMQAFTVLRENGFRARNIRVYVLIGFNDTPEDALYRLKKVRELGMLPNPMRYQPLNSTTKNNFIGDGWTHVELQRYVRYWSNLRWNEGIPFDEFLYKCDVKQLDKDQGLLPI